MEKKQTAMTPKEKAEELCMDFIMKTHTDDVDYGIDKHLAKQCALIVMDEILKSQPRYPSNVDWDDAGATHQYYYEAQREEAARYWEEVKQEIENL